MFKAVFGMLCLVFLMFFNFASASASANVEIEDLGRRSKAIINLSPDITLRVDNIKAKRKVRIEGVKKKVHYYLETGELLATVKRKPGSITVKMFGSNNLWKVKLKDYGLLIANNNEMTAPYKVKQKDGIFQLRRGDKKIAKVKQKDGKAKVMVAGVNQFSITNSNPDFLALLAVPELDLVFAVILITELKLDE